MATENRMLRIQTESSLCLNEGLGNVATSRYSKIQESPSPTDSPTSTLQPEASPHYQLPKLVRALSAFDEATQEDSVLPLPRQASLSVVQKWQTLKQEEQKRREQVRERKQSIQQLVKQVIAARALKSPEEEEWEGMGQRDSHCGTPASPFSSPFPVSKPNQRKEVVAGEVLVALDVVEREEKAGEGRKKLEEEAEVEAAAELNVLDDQVGMETIGRNGYSNEMEHSRVALCMVTEAEYALLTEGTGAGNEGWNRFTGGSIGIDSQSASDISSQESSEAVKCLDYKERISMDSGKGINDVVNSCDPQGISSKEDSSNIEKDDQDQSVRVVQQDSVVVSSDLWLEEWMEVLEGDVDKSLGDAVESKEKYNEDGVKVPKDMENGIGEMGPHIPVMIGIAVNVIISGIAFLFSRFSPARKSIMNSHMY